MERLTRTETSQKIIYTLGHTRWTFDKRDHSRLQDVLDWLFEYQALGTVEKLSAVVKAQEEGRVVVLPCKVGDTLYTESPISGMVTSFKAPDLAWIIENISEFGKTVFLTRAEAEAALGGGGDG